MGRSLDEINSGVGKLGVGGGHGKFRRPASFKNTLGFRVSENVPYMLLKRHPPTPPNHCILTVPEGYQEYLFGGFLKLRVPLLGFRV